MCGEMENRLKSVEAPDEEETVTRESFSDIKCNISSSTNYMISGINEVSCFYLLSFFFSFLEYFFGWNLFLSRVNSDEDADSLQKTVN